MPEYINLTCPCGRTLRADADRVGEPIRCWECGTTTIVTGGGSGGRLIRECLDGARDILRFPTVISIGLGALVISIALALPAVGAAAGLALLTIAAVFYLEVFRRSGLVADPVPKATAPSARLAAWWCLWAPTLVLGLFAPILARHALMDQYGGLVSWRGSAIWALRVVGWLGVPLLLLATSGGGGPAPAGRGLAAIRRHPLATIAALLIFPVGRVFLELVLIAVLIVEGWFGYIALDLFPTPGSDRVVLEVTDYSDDNPAYAPLSYFARTYVHGLRLGYTLTGAIPASLPRGPFVRARPWFRLPYTEWYFPAMVDWHYPAVRLLFSTLILASAGLILAIQARWLGLIATVDVRPPAPSKPGEQSWVIDSPAVP